MHLTFTGHITPEDKARSDYRYVPFDLPAPARRLHVRYRYSAPISHDKVEGGNVIDIGLFDPRGMDFPGGAGFRGWSGSDRQEFTITAAAATPGYLPGPLPAGRYHVILGLYRIWPAGAEYEITVTADLAGDTADLEDTPAASAAATSVHDAGPAASESWLWLRGDLQSHTFHSDGKGSPERLAAKARALGLDFLAITDHNTISHHAHLAALADDDLLLIPGQEVTTYYGHMNVWGTGRWCDFRCRSDADVAAVIALAHANGGLCSINHPKVGGPAWEYSLDLPVEAMEVWQGPWPHGNAASLALWDRLLQSGRRLPAVGGSDYHCPSGEETNFLRLGQPTTWLKVAGRSLRGILEAIRAGRASISATADGPRLDIQATAAGVTAAMGEMLPLSRGEPARVTVAISNGKGLTLQLLTETGVAAETVIDAPAAAITVDVPANRYIRAELVGDMPPDRLPANAPAGLDLRQWRWALSNPIYIRQSLSTVRDINMKVNSEQ